MCRLSAVRGAFWAPLVLSLGVCGVASADLTQRSGWPQQMTASVSGAYVLAPQDGVALADLDGDKKLEVVASSGDRIYVWDAEGKVKSGFPVELQGTAQATPVVGDIDGDGDLEIVQVTRGLKYSDIGRLYVYHHDGTLADGWPVAFSTMIYLPPTLADLDGNGALDLVLQISRWPPAGKIEVYSGDGQAMGYRWTYELGELPLAPVAVGDADGDGELEVAHLTRDKLWLRRSDGTVESGFPLSAATGRDYAGGVLLIDLDGDGKLELVAGEEKEVQSGLTEARLLAYDAAGKAASGFPAALSAGVTDLKPPTAGDLDGDGKPELVVGLRGVGIAVVQHDGTVSKVSIPSLTDIQAPVGLLDLDGDGKLEFVVDNNAPDKTTLKGYLGGYNADGSALTGFPLRPRGAGMSNIPSLADLDGDGTPELVAVSNLISPLEVWVNVWSISGARPGGWPTHGADPRRSHCPGCAAASKSGTFVADGGTPDTGTPDAGPDQSPTPDLDPPDAAHPDAAAPGDTDEGCTCTAGSRNTPAPTALLLSLLLALGLWLRRR